MNPSELKEAIQVSKNRGNYFFYQNDLTRALRCYGDGLKKSESHLPSASDNEKDNPEKNLLIFIIMILN